jgi:predicted amidophosphoribosyltransferase
MEILKSKLRSWRLPHLLLTLNLLTTTIVAPPSNASKWQMGFNSAFKGLKSYQNVVTLNLLTTTIVALPSNASKWQMGFNSAFKGLIIT